MKDNQNISLEDEKRRFFRIEDLVHLSCNVLDERSFNEKIQLLEKGVSEQFLVMSDLSAISSEMSASLRRIESREPEIADYLRSIDRKIDLLGRAIMSEEFGVNIDSAVPVNLSASGVGIKTGRAIPENSSVEVRMILLPDHVGVMAYGSVVACEEQDDERYPYLVRVDFTHLRDEDRDLLIRHIMRKQGEMLRERRIARENGEN
jgi:hypothetical protein